MRRMIFPAVLAVCALLLCACNVSEMGSLEDLSKPYTGVYECEDLTLGGESVLDKFEYIRLELKGDGTFALSYKTASGGGGGVGGEYAMDAEHGELTLSKQTPLRTASHVFAVKDGAILADFNFRGRLLHARFSMP